MALNKIKKEAAEIRDIGDLREYIQGMPDEIPIFGREDGFPFVWIELREDLPIHPRTTGFMSLQISFESDEEE